MKDKIDKIDKTKSRYMTMRLPADVEVQLRAHAGINTRTLAAQILHYVKAGIAHEEAQRQQADVKISKMKSDGTLARRATEKALADQVKWGGVA